MPSFGDLQTKIAWTLPHGRELTIFGLRSRESTDAEFSDSSMDASFGLADRSSNDIVSVSLASTLGTRGTSRTVASWYRFGDALDVDGSQRDETRRFNVPGDDAFGRASIVFTRGVTVDDASRLEAIVSDLRALGDVSVERNRGIVAIVGGAIADGGDAMACALGAIGGVRVHMLSLSATGINLTLVVDDEQVKPAMQRLPAAFFDRSAS